MKSNKLPKEINILNLADHGAQMAGIIDIADMSRLEPSLVSSAHKAEVTLEFGIDVEKLRYVKGHIKAKLALVCQRCLKPMDYRVDDAIALSPVFNENEANELPSCYEPVMIANHETQSLTALIEDELILRLPIVALHENQDCVPGSTTNTEHAQPIALDAGDAANHPFAVLADLKSLPKEKTKKEYLRGKKNGCPKK